MLAIRKGDDWRYPACQLQDGEVLRGLPEVVRGVALDRRGFVLTGSETNGASRPLETSVRGVFAIGDVRSGSIKRVAAAVGQGAQVVATLHAVLAVADRPPSGHPS